VNHTGVIREYPAKSVGNQGEEFLIEALVKVVRILYQEFSKFGDYFPRCRRDRTCHVSAAAAESDDVSALALPLLCLPTLFFR
jgi:hypothetical protein